MIDLEELQNIKFNSSTKIQIRFNDVDIVGHINNAVQVSYLDYGKIKYYEHVKQNVINWHEAEFVVVNINVNYIEPIFMHEHIEVLTKIIEIGNKSVKMLQIIRETENGRVKTVAQTVMCGFDPKTSTSVVVSDTWRDLIRKFENMETF